jgi:tRNA pseudouridine55 synthase
MDGLLNINKPRGKTSFSVVALVKHLSREKRVGHAGTLDPEASGVLPVCLGKGTRVVEFLMDTSKTYHAWVELGITTDTYDSSGKVVARGDFSGVTRKNLEVALEAFRGVIDQVPPMYSALKHHGTPLYQLARSGIEIERKGRPATIFRLELLDWLPPAFELEIECSKGTYIRSLAHDLGHALGCGACLQSLVRTRCGVFDIKDSISLSSLEEAFRYGYWQQYVYPVDTALQRYQAVVVDETTEKVISSGGIVTLQESAGFDKNNCSGSLCRAYSLDGRLLAVLQHVQGNTWHSRKVFI